VFGLQVFKVWNETRSLTREAENGGPVNTATKSPTAQTRGGMLKQEKVTSFLTVISKYLLKLKVGIS
jgi:hypothetical protein